MNKKALKTKSYSQGFSIVELMIAIFIGLIVLTGLITVFDTSSRMSRTQNGLARIQENGRYAISLLKQQISQAGYQYCMGENNAGVAAGETEPTKLGWSIQATTGFIPGFPVGPNQSFDPAYLIFGHECDNASCVPNIGALGTDLSAAVPAIGVLDGERIAGTDVLTIRYLRNLGREVANTTATPPFTIAFTPFAAANPPTVMPASGQVLLASCGNNEPVLLDITGNGAGAITVAQQPPGIDSLMKAFNFQRDFMTVTYYVANNIIDGRSIPTLYSSVNGAINPIIEGVDAFDLTYGVEDFTGATLFTDAAGVQAMTATCWNPPRDIFGAPPIVNTAGCGWRSVASVEVHMLLNSIYNSSNFDGAGNEPFRYSPYGDGFSNQTNLPVGIPHYSMHRKEFFTTIALKNIMH